MDKEKKKNTIDIDLEKHIQQSKEVSNALKKMLKELEKQRERKKKQNR